MTAKVRNEATDSEPQGREGMGSEMTDTLTTEALAAMTPNPGSPQAVDRGCTCPVLDNGHGRPRPDGNFWISKDCPLHGAKESASE